MKHIATGCMQPVLVWHAFLHAKAATAFSAS